MIKELARKTVFAPRRLINEMVRWILGVHSSEGTIRVANTATPGEERSLDLNVDVDAMKGYSDEWAASRGLSDAQREETANVMRQHLDGVTLVWQNELASVNSDWLDARLEGLKTDDDGVTLADAGASAPESYAETPTTGSAETAARSDHTHRFQTAAETATTTSGSNVQSELDALNKALDEDEKTIKDHGTRIAALEGADTQTCDCAGNWAAQKQKNADLEAAVEAAEAKAAALAAVVTNKGTPAAPDYRVPLSKLTGSIDGHSGTCLVTIGDDGTLGHTNKSGADVALLGAAADRYNDNDGTTKLLTDGDLSSDTEIKDLKALVATEEGSPETVASGGNVTGPGNGDTWTKGATEGQGATLKVFTRSVENGSAVAIYCRQLTISSDGRITAIGAEESFAYVQIGPPA